MSKHQAYYQHIKHVLSTMLDRQIFSSYVLSSYSIPLRLVKSLKCSVVLAFNMQDFQILLRFIKKLSDIKHGATMGDIYVKFSTLNCFEIDVCSSRNIC